MKKLLLFTIYMSLTSIFAFAQPIQINTDLNWQVSASNALLPPPANTFNLPAFNVTGCLDPNIVMCICGNTGQAAPTVRTCNAVDPAGNPTTMEIWGAMPQCVNNIPCTYAPGVFWFQRVIELDSCTRATQLDLDVQGDNILNLYINGINVLNTAAASWFSDFTTIPPGNVNINPDPFGLPQQIQSYNQAFGNGGVLFDNAVNNIINNIAPGTPITIQARVQNTGGAPCINYAFFSLCGTLTTQDVNLTPTFAYSGWTGPNANGLFTQTISLTNNLPNVNPPINIVWTAQNMQLNPAGPWNNLPFVLGNGGTSITIQSPMCFDVRVNAAITWGTCTGGRRTNIPTPCERLTSDGGGKRLISPDIKEEILSYEQIQEILQEKKKNDSQLELNKIKLSPNPTSHTFSIEMGQIDAQEIRIFNTTNDLVYVVYPESRKKIDGIDITNLSSGLYFVIVTDKSGATYTEKLQVQH